MCRKIECSECHKWTWQGCGLHIKKIFHNVKEEDRCKCRLCPAPFPDFELKWGPNIPLEFFRIVEYPENKIPYLLSKFAQAFIQHKISGFNYMTFYRITQKYLSFQQRKNFLTYYGWTLLNQIIHQDIRNKYQSEIDKMDLETQEEWVKEMSKIVIYGIRSFHDYKKLLLQIHINLSDFSNSKTHLDNINRCRNNPTSSKTQVDDVNNFRNELNRKSFIDNTNIFNYIQEIIIHHQDKINPEFDHWFYSCQTFHNLMYSLLKTCQTNLEIQLAQTILKDYLLSFYNYLGIEVYPFFLDNYHDDVILKNLDSETLHDEDNGIPLPHLPGCWKWDPSFVKTMRCNYQAIALVHQIEWDFLHTFRLYHHYDLIMGFFNYYNQDVSKDKKIIMEKDKKKKIFQDKEDLSKLFRPNFLRHYPDFDHHYLVILRKDIYDNFVIRCKFLFQQHKHPWTFDKFTHYFENHPVEVVDIILRSIRHDGVIDLCYVISRLEN